MTEDEINIGLPALKGVSCEFSGQRIATGEISALSLLCQNDSSDTVQVQLYAMLKDEAGSYLVDYEMAAFWLVSQIGENIDQQEINAQITAGQLFGLKVSIYDPWDLDNWITQGQYIFTLDLSNNSSTIVDTVAIF